MADHDIDDEKVDARPLKETLFDSISEDRNWLSEKQKRMEHVIATKERMLQLMIEHPVIEEWFKMYKDITRS